MTNVPTTTTGIIRTARKSSRPGVMSKVLRNPLGITSLVIIGVMILLSILAPVLAPYPANFVHLPSADAPPFSEGHPLGADSSGRDVLSRLLVAGQLTLLGAAITIVTAIAFGVTTGLIAGYFGKFFDTAACWIADLVLVLPTKIVLVAMFAIIGPNTLVTMFVLGVMLAPGFFRLVRNLVIGVKHELYVDAARVSGLTDARIIGRHVLYAVRAPIIIQAAFAAGIAVVIQAGLEFIGLGDPSTPTWGGMLQEAFASMYKAPFLLLWPGIVIGLFVGASVLLGNAVRDALEGSGPAPVRRSGPRGKAVVHDAGAAHDQGALLSIQNLSVGYPDGHGGVKVVVEDVSFAVRAGEVVGLVGESGSGKSQTAFSVLGLLPSGGRVVAGSIQFDGAVLDRVRGAGSLRGKRIAYVPQEPMSNLDPAFKIGSQLVEPLVVVHGLSRSAARKRALELLAQVGIVDPERVFNSYPYEVSGGMAQRVLIAGAISGEPDLIIADEPTTALDVTVQAEILDILRDLQRDHGMAMLLVTHNFGVVADLCDRIVVMQLGKVVETGAAEEIFRSPEHPYTRMLLDSILDGGPAREPYSAEAVAASQAAAREVAP